MFLPASEFYVQVQIRAIIRTQLNAGKLAPTRNVCFQLIVAQTGNRWDCALYEYSIVHCAEPATAAIIIWMVVLLVVLAVLILLVLLALLIVRLTRKTSDTYEGAYTFACASLFSLLRRGVCLSGIKQ